MNDNKISSNEANTLPSRFQRYLDKLIYILGIFFTLYVIYFAATLWTTRLRYSIIFLGLGLTLYYLHYISKKLKKGYESYSGSIPIISPSKKAKKTAFVIDIAYCIILIATIIISVSYVWFEFDRLLQVGRIIGINQVDVYIGLLLIYIIVDATTRAYGWSIGGVVVLTLLYGFLGPWLPSIFFHRGFTLEQTARFGGMNLEGMFGFILGVGSTWVAIFIMFAGIARAFGLLAWLSNLGKEMAQLTQTGVVHSALIASMVMGSITGSAAANSATTGAFTIPMMKDQGIKAEYAAAIESVASSGGQILPPVMGVAAFLMADILGVSYFRIVQAGLLPAVLFYLTVALSIHLIVYKFDWTVEKKEKNIDRDLFLESLRYVIPLGVLLYTLTVMRLTPLAAGYYTIITFVLNVFIFDIIKSKDLSFSLFKGTISDILNGFARGAVDMAPLVSILAALGIILGVLQQTGLTQRLSFQLIFLAGGSFVLLLILTMIASILFGLGMPTPAAYILVVILTAPALLQFGVQDITAHMFVFYGAILSAITPPVAIAVAVTSRIAESNFIQSCVNAIRVGIVAFLLPFIFVMNDSLIYWAFPNTLFIMLTVSVGCLALSVGVIGHDTTNHLPHVNRIIFVGLGMVTFFAPLTLKFVSTILIILILVYTWRR